MITFKVLHTISLPLVAHGIGNSIGEKVFIAMLTSIVISIFLFFWNKRTEKREARRERENFKREERQAQEAQTEEEEYFKTLYLIAFERKSEMLFDYDWTIKQLLDKCNPKCFLSPYSPEKVEIATRLFSRLKNLGNNYDKREVRLIRKEANEKLNIELSSEKAYSLLTTLFNPSNYIDEKFDEKKLIACNKAFQHIEKYKTDLRKLEQFAYKIGILKI